MFRSKGREIKHITRYIPIYLMMLPGIAYLIINNFMPLFGLTMAFKKINWQKGIFGSEWCGLDNFKYLFRTKDAFIMTRNTILYNVVFIILGIVASLCVALFLNEIRGKASRKFYQTLILIPNLMSMVIVNYLAFAMLSNETGFINGSILPALGLEPVNWYMEPKYWPFILTIVNLWKSVGMSSIIYYASIVGISGEYYEAARLDGASKWQQIRNITLPLIKPTIIMLFIMSCGRIMGSDFGLFYQIPRDSGALYSVTQTIDTYVYRALMKTGNITMSMAASAYQSIVGFVLIMVANGIARKYSSENALF